MQFFKHDPDRETVQEVSQSHVHNALGFALTADLIRLGCLRTGGIVWECREWQLSPAAAEEMRYNGRKSPAPANR